MRLRVLFVAALLCLLPAFASAQTPVPTDKPVQLLSGPSNEITLAPPRLAFEQSTQAKTAIGSVVIPLADIKWELVVNGTASELAGVTCVIRSGFTDLYDCSASQPVLPEGAKVTVRAYRIIPPPPAPGLLRIIGG